MSEIGFKFVYVVDRYLEIPEQTAEQIVEELQ